MLTVIALCAVIRVEVVQKPVNHQGEQTVDLIVCRPAGRAGQHKSRRLRLGGKQKPAGRDLINSLANPVAIDFDAL